MKRTVLLLTFLLIVVLMTNSIHPTNGLEQQQPISSGTISTAAADGSKSTVTEGRLSESEWARLFATYQQHFNRQYRSEAMRQQAFAAFKKHHIRSLALNEAHQKQSQQAGAASAATASLSTTPSHATQTRSKMTPASSLPAQGSSAAAPAAAVPKPIFNALTSPLADKTDAELNSYFRSGPPRITDAHHRMVEELKVRTAAAAATAASKKSKHVQSRHRFSQFRRLLQSSSGTNSLTPISPQSPGQPPSPDAGDNMGPARTGGGNSTTSSGDNTPADQYGSFQSFSKWWSVHFGTLCKFDGSGYFPPPRNQGPCQSCWANVAVEHFQAVIVAASASPPLGLQGAGPRLSVQQIIDCQVSSYDHGCSGGTVTGAFDFMQQTGSVSSYAYPNGQDGTQHSCATPRPNEYSGAPYNGRPTITYKAPPSLFFAPPILDATSQPSSTVESDLMAFWQNHAWKPSAATPVVIPMIAYVDASNWDDYSSGIFPASQCSSAGTALNHVVQIVGLDQRAGQPPFWLVRNSWSATAAAVATAVVETNVMS